MSGELSAMNRKLDRLLENDDRRVTALEAIVQEHQQRLHGTPEADGLVTKVSSLEGFRGRVGKGLAAIWTTLLGLLAAIVSSFLK